MRLPIPVPFWHPCHIGAPAAVLSGASEPIKRWRGPDMGPGLGLQGQGRALGPNIREFGIISEIPPSSPVYLFV